MIQTASETDPKFGSSC